MSSILDADQRILNRASLNVSDGASLLNIADSAVDSVKQLVTRMTELAAQASNGALNFRQRSNLDKEYQALDREIRRIADTAQFNGLALLEGRHTAGAGSAVRLGGDGYTYNLSADGQFISYCRNLSGIDMDVLDTVSGQNYRIAAPDGTNIYEAEVLVNGDAVFAGGELMDLYYWSRETQSLTKLTNNQNMMNFSEAFDVSADGSTLMFRSETHYRDGGTVQDVTGYSWADERMYVMDIQSGVVREVAQEGTFAFGLSPDGTKAFYGIETDALYIVDLNPGTLAPLTPKRFAGVTWASAVTNEGEVYLSTSTNLTGQNPNGCQQIFKASLASGSFTQITRNTDANIYTGSMGFTSDRTSVLFISTRNLTGENAGGFKEAFRFDLLSGQTTQLTRFQADIGMGMAYFSGDGGLMAYMTAGNRHYLDIRGSSSAFSIEAGAGAAGSILSEIPALLSAQKGLGAYSLTSAMSARASLDGLQRNMSAIGALQGKIGAAQSRLLSAGNILRSQTIETASASSRIKDVDVAEESAALVRHQILQQGAVAVMSQANQTPALALKLLTG